METIKSTLNAKSKFSFEYLYFTKRLKYIHATSNKIVYRLTDGMQERNTFYYFHRPLQ